MGIDKEKKQKVIKQYRKNEKDSGSSEVQIALLTTRIDRLTDHLKEHIHDVHSRRGLLSMIAKRRRLLNFLTKVDKKRSSTIEKKIGFEKQPLKKVEKVTKVKKK